MASYDAYLLANILPPLIIVFIILVLSYALWGISYLIFKRRLYAGGDAGVESVIEYPGLQYMFMILQPVFGSQLQARKTQHRVKVKLHREEISPAAVPLIVQSVALALGLSLAVFMTTLTVEVGSVCNEKLDCFPFNFSKQIKPLIAEPIQNCSLYTTSDAVSIVCYRFTIRFVEALSSSGGVLVLTTLGLSFYVTVLFLLAQARRCRRTGLCGCLLFLLVGCTILLGTLLWILPLALVHNKTLGLVRNWESVLIYYYTIMYLTLITTLLPCCVPRYRQDFANCYDWKLLRYQAPQDQYESENDETVTPNISNDPSQRSPLAIFNRESRHNPQNCYYGTVGGHGQLRVTLPVRHGNEATTTPDNNTAKTEDHEMHNSASLSSIAMDCSGVGSDDDKSPVVSHSARRKLSKGSTTGSKPRKKNITGRHREARGEESHWAEGRKRRRGAASRGKEDGSSEGESESSEEEGDDEAGRSQEGEVGRQDGRRAPMDGAQIRAVLTGDANERKGENSVHTRL